MSATNPQEYRKLVQKSHQLPSGATFLFRELSSIKVLEKLIEKGADISDLKNETNIQEFMLKNKVNPLEVIKVALLDATVKPKLVDGEAQNPDELSYNEISDEDRVAAFSFLLDISGLTGKGEEGRKSFRKESDRVDGRDSSAPTPSKTDKPTV